MKNLQERSPEWTLIKMEMKPVKDELEYLNGEWESKMPDDTRRCRSGGRSSWCDRPEK